MQLVTPTKDSVQNGKRKFKFSGHQTFAFRYGWLEKGVQGIIGDANLFFREDALVELGVGKNMVESIRHWCTVTQLIEEQSRRGKSDGNLIRVSEIGNRLLGEGAWDPYLEDDASLWLIHWLLVSNPAVCTTWQIAFGLLQKPDFTKGELADFVATFAEKNSVAVNTSSLSRDIDCFARTYVAARYAAKTALGEESFDCPLQSLGLLQTSPDSELYRFVIGPKASLPAEVFGYSLCDYFGRVREGLNTLSVQECLYGHGSPGQAFKIDENSLIAYVEELERITKGKIALDETAGLAQIYRRGDIDALKLLETYYRRGGSK